LLYQKEIRKMKFGIIVAAGVLALGTSAFAKTLTYTADATPYLGTNLDLGNYTYAGNNPIGVNVQTRANVEPFLDITSNGISGQFEVSGYGAGSKSADQAMVTILHNQNLTFQFGGFGNLKKDGAQDIAMTLTVQTKKGDLPWYTEYTGEASGLSAQIGTPNTVTPDKDGGFFQVALDRTITVTNANTPGLYVNTGTFTVTAN
jgi:hypothetical protein